jgi:hypothetical protein
MVYVVGVGEYRRITKNGRLLTGDSLGEHEDLRAGSPRAILSPEARRRAPDQPGALGKA